MATYLSDDEEHLRLLGIFHYVVGALTALFALFPLIHFSLGLFFVLAPPHSTQQQGAPPAIIGWFFMIIGGMFFLFGESFAACVFAAARFHSLASPLLVHLCRRMFAVRIFSLRHGAWRLYYRCLIAPFREAAVRPRRQ